MCMISQGTIEIFTARLTMIWPDVNQYQTCNSIIIKITPYSFDCAIPTLNVKMSIIKTYYIKILLIRAGPSSKDPSAPTIQLHGVVIEL